MEARRAGLLEVMLLVVRTVTPTSPLTTRDPAVPLEGALQVELSVPLLGEALPIPHPRLKAAVVLLPLGAEAVPLLLGVAMNKKHVLEARPLTEEDTAEAAAKATALPKEQRKPGLAAAVAVAG